MGGVDLADQLLKYYHIDRRTIKWYKKLFFHLLDMSVHNACVLFKASSNSKKSTLQLRLQLIDELLQNAGPDPSCRGGVAGRPRSVGNDLARLNTLNHYPSLNPTSETTGRVKFRQCRVCNKGNRSQATDRSRVETTYCCLECGSVPLCPAPCFRIWHTKATI